LNVRALIFLGAGALLLGGLFLAFRPQTASPPPAAAVPGPEATAPAAVPAPAQPQVFELTVKSGKLASGPAVIRVTQGDEIVIRVTSDKADELHLHGYDLHVRLSPGAPGELRFTASRSGRFDYELHKTDTGIGALEVQPK
jgi:FtsP/CotA-like multicopper oxidase with cupredoxin domain